VLEGFGAAIVNGLFRAPHRLPALRRVAVCISSSLSLLLSWPIRQRQPGRPVVLFCFVYLYLFAAGAGPYSLDNFACAGGAAVAACSRCRWSLAASVTGAQGARTNGGVRVTLRVFTFVGPIGTSNCEVSGERTARSPTTRGPLGAGGVPSALGGRASRKISPRRRQASTSEAKETGSAGGTDAHDERPVRDQGVRVRQQAPGGAARRRGASGP
jgi:hypothetical protein